MKAVRRQTGTNISLNSATSVELAAATNGPGTGGFDLILAAQVGDSIETRFSCLIGPEAAHTYLNVATMVSGAAVNYVLGAVAIGASPWYARGTFWTSIGGSVDYTVVAGDLSSGLVTLRPYYTQASATARVLYTDATSLFQFYAKNLGPPDAT